MSSRHPHHPQPGQGGAGWTPEIQPSHNSGFRQTGFWAAHWLCLAAWNACQRQPAVIMNKAIRGKTVVFLFLTKWLIPPPALSCRRLRRKQEMLVKVQDTFRPIGSQLQGMPHTFAQPNRAWEKVFQPRRLSQGCGFKGQGEERQLYSQ